jgi:hypothetical protein
MTASGERFGHGPLPIGGQVAQRATRAYWAYALSGRQAIPRREILGEGAPPRRCR